MFSKRTIWIGASVLVLWVVFLANSTTDWESPEKKRYKVAFTECFRASIGALPERDLVRFHEDSQSLEEISRSIRQSCTATLGPEPY